MGDKINMQKKIMKSFTIGVLVFICFVTFYDMKIRLNEVYGIMNFVTGILTIVFATCGLYMVSNNLYSKIDVSACMMATSYVLTSLLLLINILCIVNQLTRNEMLVQVRENNLYRNILEILFLIISTEVISDKPNIKCWIFGAVFITVISIFLSLSNTVLTVEFKNEYMYIVMENIIGVCVACIAITGLVIRKLKYNKSSMTDNRILDFLYINRVLNGILIMQVGRSSIIVNTLYNLLDLIFYIGVFSYICEVTLDVEWRSIELKVDSKEEEVQKKLIEKRILVASAKSVREKISNISNNAKCIKQVAEEKSMLKEANYIQKIIKNCNRLTKLSQNIVSLNKYDAGVEKIRFEKQDMVQIIKELTSSIDPYLEDKELKLQFITSQKEAICYIDREAIERILLNLVSNSVKYSKYQGYINIVLFTRKEKMYLVVQDTGIGIPEHLISTVFKQYARAESDLIRLQEGSGLGLTIVKSLVDLHGGEIEIKSKIDKGTSINIILPVYQEDNQTINYNNKFKNTEIIKKIEIEFSDIEV